MHFADFGGISGSGEICVEEEAYLVRNGGDGGLADMFLGILLFWAVALVSAHAFCGFWGCFSV